jgi:hypothetical protein
MAQNAITKKVDIGSGKKISGWITCDANPRANVDVISTLPPVPAGFKDTDVFRLIHVLEHFDRWDACRLLDEFHEFLTPGGQLVLELPNLQSAIDALSGKSGKPKKQWGMWVLYGDPSHKNQFYTHRWGWTPETLSLELERVGFRRIVQERPKFHVPDRDFRLVAFKGD